MKAHEASPVRPVEPHQPGTDRESQRETTLRQLRCMEEQLRVEDEVAVGELLLDEVAAAPGGTGDRPGD